MGGFDLFPTTLATIEVYLFLAKMFSERRAALLNPKSSEENTPFFFFFFFFYSPADGEK